MYLNVCHVLCEAIMEEPEQYTEKPYSRLWKRNCRITRFASLARSPALKPNHMKVHLSRLFTWKMELPSKQK